MLFCNEEVEKMLITDKKLEFLKYLAKNYEEGEVKQGDYALRLYQFFLSHEKKTIKEASSCKPDLPPKIACQGRHRNNGATD
jgi:hypothetical protein